MDQQRHRDAAPPPYVPLERISGAQESPTSPRAQEVAISPIAHEHTSSHGAREPSRGTGAQEPHGRAASHVSGEVVQGVIVVAQALITVRE